MLLKHAPTKGPLTTAQYSSRMLSTGGVKHIALAGAGFSVSYAVASFRGYYPMPGMEKKPNQDSYCCLPGFGGEADQCFMGVFDGHGENGHRVSQYAAQKVPELFAEALKAGSTPADAMKHACVETNTQLHHSVEIDDRVSGTTAITAFLHGSELYIGNVGDSRAIACLIKGDTLKAEALSRDQNCYRDDEYDRVREAGATVLAYSQLEGRKDPEVKVWKNEETDEDDDEPYIWFPTGGAAFTRSIGDGDAEVYGVYAEPEVRHLSLQPEHAFVVIASDGVWEFLSTNDMAELLADAHDLQEACYQAVYYSYRLWVANQGRTDDITIIIMHLDWASLALTKDVLKKVASDISLASVASRVHKAESNTDLQAMADTGKVIDKDAALHAPSATAKVLKQQVQQPAALPAHPHQGRPSLDSPARRDPATWALLSEAWQRNDVLRKIEKREMNKVLDVMLERKLKDGDVWLEEGAVPSNMCIISHGDMELREGGALVRTYMPWEVVGLLGLLSPVPSRVSIVAKGDTTVFEVSGAAMRSAMKGTTMTLGAMNEYVKERNSVEHKNERAGRNILGRGHGTWGNRFMHSLLPPAVDDLLGARTTS